VLNNLLKELTASNDNDNNNSNNNNNNNNDNDNDNSNDNENKALITKFINDTVPKNTLSTKVQDLLNNFCQGLNCLKQEIDSYQEESTYEQSIYNKIQKLHFVHWLILGCITNGLEEALNCGNTHARQKFGSVKN